MSEIKPELRFPMFNEQWEEKLLKDFTSISAGKDYKLTINFGGQKRDILSSFVEKN